MDSLFFPSLMLEISNSWGLFLSKMLKSNIPKDGGTKEREFAAILTLKSCNILGFITHKKKTNKMFDPHYLLLLIWSSAYASWMESNAISLSQKQIICDLESPTLDRATRRCAASEVLPCFTPWNDAVNSVLLISLSVQTHWRKVESAYFVAEADLRWRFQWEPPPIRYRSIQERVERIKTQGLATVTLSIEFLVPSNTPFVAVLIVLFCVPVNVVKRGICYEASRLDYCCVRKGKIAGWKGEEQQRRCVGTCVWPLPDGNTAFPWEQGDCLASVLLSAHFRDSIPQARSFIPPHLWEFKTVFACYHSLLFYCRLSDGILQSSATSLWGCRRCRGSLTDVSYLAVVLYQWGGGISNRASLLWFLSLSGWGCLDSLEISPFLHVLRSSTFM